VIATIWCLSKISRGKGRGNGGIGPDQIGWKGPTQWAVEWDIKE
jgi:hypothetical protein